MSPPKVSRNALDGKIINVRRGLAIYKVKASPYYRVRVWLPSQKKRVVRTTRTVARAEAISIAEELLSSMGSRGVLRDVPKDRTFQHFADMLVKREKVQGERGERSRRSWLDTQSTLGNSQRGLLSKFGKSDVSKITTQDYHTYFQSASQNTPPLAPATLNRIAVTFSKVMKLALIEGVINSIPSTPRFRRKDNPRPFFRFHPLVEKKNDQYKLLLEEAEKMASERVVVRGTTATDELRDFVLFLTHSFMRPTESEIYSITHRDIAIARNPKRLRITVKKGKTGHRVSNSMEGAVSVYNRIKQRYREYKEDDFIFLPKYKNRSHAKRIMQRQFNVLLERCKLKRDNYSKSEHTVYSLRHTAICMRLVLSEGKVNIFNLAKNAGTSVDQIERFYARNLPQSAAMT